MKSFLGISAPLFGLTISTVSAIEQWLRVASLVIGCAVGIATFISITRKKKEKE